MGPRGLLAYALQTCLGYLSFFSPPQTQFLLRDPSTVYTLCFSKPHRPVESLPSGEKGHFSLTHHMLFQIRCLEFLTPILGVGLLKFQSQVRAPAVSPSLWPGTLPVELASGEGEANTAEACSRPVRLTEQQGAGRSLMGQAANAGIFPDSQLPFPVGSSPQVSGWLCSGPT